LQVFYFYLPKENSPLLRSFGISFDRWTLEISHDYGFQ